MESNLVKKLFYKEARIYGTDLHVLEFSPSDFEMVVSEGNPDKKEPLSEIRHSWYEERGYSRVAAINMQFFWLVSLGLQYLDKGYLNNNGTIDDQFLELIYENRELKIDNIVGTDIKSKYPKAEWAIGVGFQLIKDGKINTRYGEKFDHYNYRHPRTAIGQKKDGSIIWLVTDGRTGEDRGLTGQQLADIMLDLGCVIAISFDGGGSTTMCIGNKDKIGKYKVINELAGNIERAIGSGLLLYAKNWTVENKVFYYKNYIPENTAKRRRPGAQFTPKYITVHSTANPKSSARDELNWLKNTNNKDPYRGANAFVDDKECIEVIPLSEPAWHAGDGEFGTGNNESLSLEICESGNREQTILNAVDVVARWIKQFNLSIDVVVQHKHWTGKNCPRILMGEDWQDFLKLVVIKLGLETEEKDYKKENAEFRQRVEILEECIKNIEDLVKNVDQGN